MNLHVIRSIFRRNFVSYFSSPTGYVFICVFVLLSAFAAFWPNDFFNANLANLDQLNKYLPFIMLVFIPAITMSIWTDERRAGTDELLLTIPAGDFDVVIGKYLAAVAIYTVSLLFSLSNILVMVLLLGTPDFGLLVGNYVGYWLVGLAMLSIGMVASFLTGNLTVGFILGAVLNAPLVFAEHADVVFGTQAAAAVSRWSIGEQFRDFGRGVISLSGVIYFGSIIVVMLYLSMVLIGRRHWVGGRDGRSMGGHYLVRAVALIGVAVAAVTFVARADTRLDVTTERLSSLSPQTRKLLRDLDVDKAVRIDAFVSPRVPESYVQTRLDLLSLLREFDARGRGAVSVRIHNTEKFSDEAARAEDQFGIQSREVPSRSRGALSIDDIFMGVAVTSGLDRVVVPFIDRGVPVEYELVRSIATVTQEERKRVGVLTTDAKLYGGFDMQTMTQSRNERLIDELEKQYEVQQVNADGPITERYDVLLAVQPSSLTQPQMENFIAAVRSGQPTAIFEDPFPYVAGNVPGTSAPRRPAGGGNPFMGQQPPPEPKGNIVPLWNLLGVDFTPSEVVWQDYNPYPRIQEFPREFVFVDAGSGQSQPFNDQDAISSKLQQMLFLFPGSVRRLNTNELEFTPLVRTGEDTGTVAHSDILAPSPFGFGGGDLNPQRRWRPTGEEYVLAARIHGKLPSEAIPMSDAGFELAQNDAQVPEAPAVAPPADGDEQPGEEASDAAQAPKKGDVNVVLVADIDLLYSAFFNLRDQGTDPDAPVNLQFDNVTFVLNTLDMLAGDERFIEIRKRRPVYRTLTQLEASTEKSRDQANEKREEFLAEFRKNQEAEQDKFEAEIAKLNQRKDLQTMEALQLVAQAQAVGQKRLDAKVKQLGKERDQQIQRIETSLANEIRRKQNRAKFLAVICPPIPPLLVAVFVFLSRKSREQEGIEKSRRR